MPIYNKNVKKSKNISYTVYDKYMSNRNPEEFLKLMVNNTNYKSVFSHTYLKCDKNNFNIFTSNILVSTKTIPVTK